jgi:hypothetical protein
VGSPKEIVLDDENAADIEDGDRVDEEDEDDEEDGTRSNYSKKRQQYRDLDQHHIEVSH